METKILTPESILADIILSLIAKEGDTWTKIELPTFTWHRMLAVASVIKERDTEGD